MAVRGAARLVLVAPLALASPCDAAEVETAFSVTLLPSRVAPVPGAGGLVDHRDPDAGLEAAPASPSLLTVLVVSASSRTPPVAWTLLPASTSTWELVVTCAQAAAALVVEDPNRASPTAGLFPVTVTSLRRVASPDVASTRLPPVTSTSASASTTRMSSCSVGGVFTVVALAPSSTEPPLTVAPLTSRTDAFGDASVTQSTTMRVGEPLSTASASRTSAPVVVRVAPSTTIRSALMVTGIDPKSNSPLAPVTVTVSSPPRASTSSDTEGRSK